MRLHYSAGELLVDTPAKLNLYLNVLGRRSDGYHELDTLMISVGLYDTLRFRKLPGASDSADLPTGPFPEASTLLRTVDLRRR